MKKVPFALGAVFVLALSGFAFADNPPKPNVKLTSSAEEPTPASSSDERPSFFVDLSSLETPSSSEVPASSSEAPPPASSAEVSLPEEPSEPASEEPAAPAGPLVTARNPQSVLDVLSSLGYPGKLGTFDGNRPTISLRIAGLNTYIDFYDCADDMTDCNTLLFGVDLTLKKGATAKQVNDWNSNQITGRVYTDDKGNPSLDYSLSTFEGISPAVFDDTVRLWAQVLDDFKSSFNFR